MEEIPKFKIGDLEMQGVVGAMGVGNTGPDFINSLYEAGKKEGVPNFFGTLSAVGGGVLKGYFKDAVKENQNELNKFSGDEKKDLLAKLYIEADNRSLEEDIDAIRGTKALNLMVATSNYQELANTAISRGIDMITIGAGADSLKFPSKIPSGSDVLLGPLVNGGKGANLYCRIWGKKGHMPDFLVLEGPKAGGHVAYNLEQLTDSDFVENGLERLFREVADATKDFRTGRGERIPILVAGGIFDGYDIKRVLSWEEDGIKPAGVQMATRWLCASDASDEHKQACIDAKGRKIISSPVKMYGSAIENIFVQRVEKGEKHPTGCAYRCLSTCDPDKVDYCIAKGLINTRNGNVDEGVIFVGSGVKYCSDNNFRSNGKFKDSEFVSRDLAREYDEAVRS